MSLRSSCRGFNRPQSRPTKLSRSGHGSHRAGKPHAEIDIKLAVQEVIIQGLGRRIGQNRGALDRTVVHNDADLDGAGARARRRRRFFAAGYSDSRFPRAKALMRRAGRQASRQ